MNSPYTIDRHESWCTVEVNDSRCWIRDDMNLDIQCDLMLADFFGDHMPADDVAHMVDVARDDLRAMRDEHGVVDVPDDRI